MKLGEGIIEGRGDAQIYASPDYWYVRVGAPEPAQRMNLRVAFLSLGSYLWVGHGGTPPRFPDPLPPADPIDPRERPTMADMKAGSAIMFGAGTSIEAGGQFTIFYGEVLGSAGFDIAFRHFGDNASCQSPSGRRYDGIGLNGWYADGQLYAGLAIKVGIDVDLLFTSGRFDIFDASVASTLRGGMPNPTWFTGVARGRYSILGGAVSGNMEYEFKKGDGCAPLAPSPLLALDLVSDLQPRDGARDVSVFIEPMAAFNMTINEPFDLQDVRGDNHRYRIVSRGVQVRLDNANGAVVPGETIMGDENTTAYFNPANPLEPNTFYWASVTATGEEWVNGRWQAAVTDRGEGIGQTLSARFRTGDFPRQIDDQHVSFTYPYERQRVFLQNECRMGTVGLWEDYSRLNTRFSDDPMGNPQIVARFESAAGGAPIEVPATLNAQGVQFNIPTLQPETAYAIQIIRRVRSLLSSDVLASGVLNLPAGQYYGQTPTNAGSGRGTVSYASTSITGQTGVRSTLASLNQQTPTGTLQAGLAANLRGTTSEVRVTNALAGASSGAPTVNGQLVAGLSTKYVQDVSTRPAAAGVDVVVRERQLPGQRLNPGERLLYRTFFRTSRFSTFQEKLNATTFSPVWRELEAGFPQNVTSVNAGMEPSERFDLYDLSRNERKYNGRR